MTKKSKTPSKTPHLDALRNFGNIAEELRNNPPSAEFWEELDRYSDKLHKKQEKERKSYKMSYEKFHQPFTI